MLRKITIKQKVYFLAALGAILAMFLSITAVIAIESVGVKLKQIAKEDIPMTNIVTAVTTHQLEQAIQFERAVRYAEVMEHNPKAVKHKTRPV